jgi:fumarate hydratase class II
MLTEIVEIRDAASGGAQTARSLTYFAIGAQTMPLALVHAMAWIKWGAAVVNCELLLLDPARGRHEADGVIQRIPGYQQKVEPLK